MAASQKCSLREVGRRQQEGHRLAGQRWVLSTGAVSMTHLHLACQPTAYSLAHSGPVGTGKGSYTHRS